MTLNVTPSVTPSPERYHRVRSASETLCAPLEVEDYGLQGMAATSPPKWHLAHVTWFFETFVLKPFASGYRPPHPQYEVLFNSYYNGIGEQYPRPQRGLLSRPTVAEIIAYRRTVDAAVIELLECSDTPAEALARIELGLHHEQQHQELLLTDLKYSFSLNPLKPRYRERPATSAPASAPAQWLQLPAGRVEIGAQGPGFCFDNETPRHSVWLQPAALASRPVSNAEYLAFIEDGGYQRPELWLADGWDTAQREGWCAPLYWQRDGDAWRLYTLHGLEPLDGAAPVCHVSYFEADAYARWAGARLPTEAEWEVLAASEADCAGGQFVESGELQPNPGHGNALFGGVWEWSASSYSAYPGFRPAAGAVGEYNGKFMCSQYVLRGGSCATPAEHIRSSYRNFFYPPDRWQFSGIRLARDADTL